MKHSKKILNKGYNVTIKSLEDFEDLHYETSEFVFEDVEKVKNIYKICKDLFSYDGILSLYGPISEETLKYIAKNKDILSDIKVANFDNLDNISLDNAEYFIMMLSDSLFGYNSSVDYKIFGSMECLYSEEDVYAKEVKLYG